MNIPMSTYTWKYSIRCDNDCKISWCPWHKIEIAYQNTSDWFTYTKDWEINFWMDKGELEEMLKWIKSVADANMIHY